jgi:hypothetical protein
MGSGVTVPFLWGHINLLIVEDDGSLLSMLKRAFSLPYVNVVEASSMKKAQVAIARPGVVWHCWIVDMRLGENENAGMELIENHGRFPFSVVYSGLGSMERAAGALQKGAAAVIDKGPATFDKLIGEVCSLMPLGVLCNGTIRKKKECLFLLKNHTIKNPKEWADKAMVTIRQIENVSINATGIPPSFSIPFYYGLRYLLLECIGAEKLCFAPQDSAFYRNCVEYLEKNLDYYDTMLPK